MDKDTFLNEINKVREVVNWTQVAKDLDLNVRTINWYIDGHRQDTNRMLEILQCAKDQLLSRGTQCLKRANSLII
ncbi:MAG: hypothetical protein HKN40_00380 [Winogradskyella sp.]|uniref:hypothetical protein n=1 Tax=Winogradskyella sp. TaxID=1883156 RepID=UPI00182D24EB|nr:hypothetical protein [Winogradskyella sp.]